MELKKTLKKALLSIPILLGLTFFIALSPYALSTKSIQVGPTILIKYVIASSIKEQVLVGLPVSLKIPSINVDAHVEYLGLTSSGAMDVSDDPMNVTWFNLGPHPGENGSAVIAGHYGWKNHTPAVFDNLHKLNKGDRVFVEDEKGVITTFIVNEIRNYGKDEIVPNAFESNDGKAHLNLITCTGVWNNVTKTFSERLIVFTDEE
ncbi:MAG: class F sortase [Candidatus Peregrinibacteria bacterium]|nr:class F sortase [Candidatus Peregrinibacteria bacterium]MDZ4244740.1 class F sortase [Candidatus Gracilibacteria bacterium]